MIRSLLNIPRVVVQEARQFAELRALARQQYGPDSPFWGEFEAEFDSWRRNR